jgi:hypothetical protein
MSLTIKIVLWLVLSILIVSRAHTEPVLEEGNGVICDTQAQILEFASRNATPEAIQQINVGKTVCALVNVRYYRGEEVARTTANNKSLQVVKILVVEVNVHGVWGSIKPEVQYTLFAIEEVPA